MKLLWIPLVMMALGTWWHAPQARAEYRAYELEVTDILDCQLNKREKCRRFRVSTAMSPSLYVSTHGGQERIGVVMLATWMCWGDTSDYRAVCPIPAPRKPVYKVGDDVTIKLAKHITDGWKGKVEVAYYQRSVNANVYGIRFEDRKGVYSRYFEKDLTKIQATPTGGVAQ